TPAIQASLSPAERITIERRKNTECQKRCNFQGKKARPRQDPCTPAKEGKANVSDGDGDEVSTQAKPQGKQVRGRGDQHAFGVSEQCQQQRERRCDQNDAQYIAHEATEVLVEACQTVEPIVAQL